MYGRATTIAQIEAGESAVAAGALESGLDTLRRAIAAARRSHHRDLLARALVSLGSSLVHAARGSDEEGAAALHEGIALAEALGDAVLAATAWREIGWVEFLRARYTRADKALGIAAELATGDEAELAWIDLIRGAYRCDVGEYSVAANYLHLAIKRADVVGADRPAAFARAVLGRLHLLRGELDDAAGHARRGAGAGDGDRVDDAPALSRVVPRRGRPGGRRHRSGRRALRARLLPGLPGRRPVLGRPRLPRGLGLVAAARGDLPRAFEMLDEAPRRCRRLPDTYLWVEAYCREALCAVGVAHDAASTGKWIDELDTIASRNGMRELLVRATSHRARLGEPGALEAARSLAAEVDNPALAKLVASLDA